MVNNINVTVLVWISFKQYYIYRLAMDGTERDIYFRPGNTMFRAVLLPETFFILYYRYSFHALISRQFIYFARNRGFLFFYNKF